MVRWSVPLAATVCFIVCVAFPSLPAYAETRVILSRDSARLIVGAWQVRTNKPIAIKGKVFEAYGQVMDSFGNNTRAGIVTFDIRGWDRFTTAVGVPLSGISGGYCSIEVDGRTVFWKPKDVGEVASYIDIPLTGAETLTIRKSTGGLIFGDPTLISNVDRDIEAVTPPPMPVINFPSFVSTAPLTLEGSSAKFDSMLRLTKENTNGVGVAWYREKIPVRKGFATSFMIKGPISHEMANEGFSFNIQNLQPSTSATEHGVLDNASVSICFDLQYGDMNELLDQGNVSDINNNHVEILVDGSTVVVMNLDALGVNLCDGQTHQIDISATETTMSVIIDAMPVFTDIAVPMQSAYDKDGAAWLGFGARTSTKHPGDGPDILSWRVYLP